MKLATRLDHIEPFYVMECAKAAAELARSETQPGLSRVESNLQW